MIRITLLIFLVAQTFCTYAQLAEHIVPDSCRNGIFSYRSRNNLLIVPITINDSIHVNMILDPQCRSVILFGKRYYKKLTKNRTAASNHPQLDKNSEGVVLHNKIALGPVGFGNATVVIVSNRNVTNLFTDVHGIMGYEGFAGYDFTIDPKTHLLTVTQKPKDTEIARLKPNQAFRQ